MSEAPLRMTPNEMKRLGYKVIDHIVDHFTNIKNEGVTNVISLKKANHLFEESIPLEPQDPIDNLNHIIENGFANILHTDHPRFFSFIPSPNNYIGVLADALASGHNAFAGHWFSGGSSARIEMTCIQWLVDLLDFPSGAGGIFTSGGSMANLMAVDVARKIKLKGSYASARIYCSDQTHSSLEKAIKILGFQADQMVKIPSTHEFKLDLQILEQRITQDSEKGLQPFCIVGNAGTTNTGTVDDLSKMAVIAQRHNCWFHVDGAYGAAAYVTEKGKSPLQGLSLADSLTLDPHKWWFQPYEIGCLLVKDHQHLRKTYSVIAEYLRDSKMQSEGEVNFYDYGIQLTRSFRALKFYWSMKTFGLKAFQKAINHGLAMAEFAQEVLESSPNWKIVTPAQLGIVSFQYQNGPIQERILDKIHLSIVDTMNKDGYASVISTTISNQKVLRLVPIHPEVTKDDIITTLEKLQHFGDLAFAKFSTINS